MAHVASWKKELVGEIVEDIKNAPVVAVVSMQGIPGQQIQAMRAGMRGHAKIKMTKNNLIRLALDEAVQYTTDMNAFKLFNKLKATMSPAPAKAGDKAPYDIVVPAGPTPFGPGPIIGELQKLGLPAQIMNGKITIKKDTTVVKEGEAISADLAAMLPKLEILPMIVGMDAKAVYGDGIVYSRSVLDIPDDYYSNMFATAAHDALAVAVEIAYPAKETMPTLIAKAYRSAYSLSVEAAIPTKETIGALFAKADSQMLAVASATGYTNDDIAARISSAPVATAAEPVAQAEQKADEEEAEEVSEDEAAAGLSALFG